MQLKQTLAALFLMIALPAAGLKAQTLEEVLDGHFDATGAKKLAKKETVTTTGKLNQSGLDIPFKQISARPNNLRIEGTFQGLTFIQTFNGTEGWMVNPFGMSAEPEPIPADQMEELKIQADLDGKFWKWEEKGYKVTLDGTEDVEGTSCFVVTVVTPDTTTYVEYIDTESYMVIKSKSKINMMGVDVESETYFSNYMQIDGIAFPGKIENRYNGVTGEIITVESIELDIKYENTLFNKPGTN